jgi:hypothetical protein
VFLGLYQTQHSFLQAIESMIERMVCLFYTNFLEPSVQKESLQETKYGENGALSTTYIVTFSRINMAAATMLVATPRTAMA